MKRSGGRRTLGGRVGRRDLQAGDVVGFNHGCPRGGWRELFLMGETAQPVIKCDLTANLQAQMLKWILTLVVAVFVLGMVAPSWPVFCAFGRLPGDLVWRFRGRTYAFPFVSVIVLSARPCWPFPGALMDAAATLLDNKRSTAEPLFS